MNVQHAYFVLADISGYTSYLAGVELDHARDVLTELLEVVVERFKAILIIQELEGDAVFAYIPKAQISRDETLLEIFESTYIAFKDRVLAIARRTTCQCNACKLIPSLDLKFVAHYGGYMTQNVSGIKKLVGTDLNLVHRLLKNHVHEATGWKAYVLLSQAALAEMKIGTEGLHKQIESYEHLGEITTYSLDLHARQKALTEARRVVIAPEQADAILSRTMNAPAEVVWGWMNDIAKRLKWETLDDIRFVASTGGRTGAGASNHCAHGKNVIIETIMDWHPFEYYTVDNPLAVQSRYLSPTTQGSELKVCTRLKMPLPRWLARPIARFMFKQLQVDRQFDTLVHLIAEEAAQKKSARDN